MNEEATLDKNELLLALQQISRRIGRIAEADLEQLRAAYVTANGIWARLARLDIGQDAA